MVRRLGFALVVGVVFSASGVAGVPAPVRAGPLDGVVCTGAVPQPAPRPDEGAPLRFGTTAAGRVFRGQPASVDGPAAVAAVDALAGDQPFVVRINRVLFEEGDAAIAAAAQRVATYSAAGHLIDLQLRYQTDGRSHVDAFADWVRRVVRAVGGDPNVVSLQVTNEANLSAPDNSDGAYPDAVEAMAAGVIAGHDEASRLGYDQIEFGFSWFYQQAATEPDFWAAVNDVNTPAFRAALDWVGLSAYPGTYFPRVLAPGLEDEFMVDALGALRCWMRFAGLGDDVPIRVAENGWPTDPVRTDLLQDAALQAMVRAVHDDRATYNVTDYSWFALWDASGAITAVQKESHYGLLRADLTPKPAFDTYRALVADLSG